MTASLRASLPAAMAVAALATAATAALAAPPPAERATRSAEGFAGDRAPDELRDLNSLRESRTAPGALVRQPKSSSSMSSGEVFRVAPDAWVYDATVDLFYDYDGDGFFRYLRVTIDADTVYSSMYVYAALFLSADGEIWEEYHVTDDFLISDSSSADAYEVETELLAGYPPGEYDLLIELYDADYGVLVDEFGPLESAELALLPLEDAEHDGVRGGTVVIVEDGGGGAGGWSLLLLLGAAAAARGTRRSAASRANGA